MKYLCRKNRKGGKKTKY